MELPLLYINIVFVDIKESLEYSPTDVPPTLTINLLYSCGKIKENVTALSLPKFFTGLTST